MGKRSAIIPRIGSRKVNESPKLPCMTFQAQCPYCTRNGRSNQSSCLSSFICAGVAVKPSIVAAWSPGMI